MTLWSEPRLLFGVENCSPLSDSVNLRRLTLTDATTCVISVELLLGDDECCRVTSEACKLTIDWQTIHCSWSIPCITKLFGSFVLHSGQGLLKLQKLQQYLL
jgi:hypothetical protein